MLKVALGFLFSVVVLVLFSPLVAGVLICMLWLGVGPPPGTVHEVVAILAGVGIVLWWYVWGEKIADSLHLD